MSDLDKMMAKLKPKKKVEEETPKEVPVEATPTEDPVIDEGDDDEDKINPPTEETTAKEKKEEPKVDIEQEIAILQNEGIFRRELLSALRELINVQMVNAQALIELKKLVENLANGKK